MDIGAGLLIVFTLAIALLAPQQIDNAKTQSDAIQQINSAMAEVDIADCKYSAEVWIGDDRISMKQLNVINNLNESLRRRVNARTVWTAAPILKAKLGNKSTPYWFRSDGATEYRYIETEQEIKRYLRCV